MENRREHCAERRTFRIKGPVINMGIPTIVARNLRLFPGNTTDRIDTILSEESE